MGLLALVVAVASGTGRAQAPIPGSAATQATPGTPQSGEKRTYTLETLELRGTTRIDAEFLQEELGLKPGIPLSDELVIETRSRLLGLGLFQSAILSMKKGSRPGTARLIVEVEDDAGVLTDWAIGGELGVTVAERDARAIDAGNAPMDYRLGLVGRNLFTDLHRGSLMLDFDSDGEFRQGQLAYGLPRFTREDVQFDAEIAATDVTQRFHDAMGFGARGQGLWTQRFHGIGELQYGAAMYVNEKPNFAVPGFPASVAGPKIAYFKETRFRGFFPSKGHLIAGSLLLAPTDTDTSVIELALARTFGIFDVFYWTLDTRVLAVGSEGYSLRGDSRFEIPLGGKDPHEDQAQMFLSLRGGHDVYGKTNLVGSAAIVGVRYHSSGFIAELALKVTKTPEELAPKKLSSEGGP